MPDDSALDKRYFIDDSIYNCPFCNRNHVSYSLVLKTPFDWTNEKKCWIYATTCHSCHKTSMHLSYSDIATAGSYEYDNFSFAPNAKEVADLDAAFFYSVPTPFFVLDSRIPNVLRLLASEAEGCLKGNFLTGASACARKVIYELAHIQEAEGDNYDERIKSLKAKNPGVDPTFFDTLLTVQEATSTMVHEESSDAWSAKHLRLILLSIKDALHEIFVAPGDKTDRRKAILKLRDEVVPGGASQKKETVAQDDKKND